MRSNKENVLLSRIAANLREMVYQMCIFTSCISTNVLQRTIIETIGSNDVFTKTQNTGKVRIIQFKLTKINALTQ